MGFKNLISSKKMLSLLAAFVLLGTNMLMAQDPTQDAEQPHLMLLMQTDNGLATAGYYILLFPYRMLCCWHHW
jgi:cytochrome c oxidase subunit 2